MKENPILSRHQATPTTFTPARLLSLVTAAILLFFIRVDASASSTLTANLGGTPASSDAPASSNAPASDEALTSVSTFLEPGSSSIASTQTPGMVMFSEPSTEKIEWGTLANVRWEWKDNFYEATFSEQQKALDGKVVEIEGFMFPLEYTRKHQTFLVSASPMSNCFFCGPGEAESMVYVVAEEAVEFTNRPVTVKGTFKLVSDASMGIIYQLDNAEMIQ